MATGIGPLFGVEIDGERKNLFGSLEIAKQLRAAVAAEGGTAVIFQHSDSEVEGRMRERASHEFMTRGVQYYVAARYSAWSGLWVCGNLYHHSVEMFLKSGLTRKYSLTELHKKFYHRLIAIWGEFKALFPSTSLVEFDTTVADITDFEDIRYPDKVTKRGAQILIDYRAQVPREPSLRPEPEYHLDFYELDRLIATIFDVSNINPNFYLSGLKPDVKEMLGRDNPAAVQLFPRQGGA